MQPVKLNRQTYLDILRLIASFFVCYNHTQGFHAFLDQTADGSFVSGMHVFLSCVTTINIPLFFMLSGALLLGKEESYRQLFAKRIWRFLVLIVCASAIVYVVKRPEGRSIPHFLHSMLSGDITISYWYLFAYLSFLLALPFLRRIAKSLRTQDVIFLIILRVLFRCVLPMLNFWLGYWDMEPLYLSGHLQIPMSSEFLFYPLLGYYLAEKFPMERVTGKHIVWCLAVFVGGNLISSGMTYAEGSYDGFSQTYLGLFNFTSAIALFIALRYFCGRAHMEYGASAFLAEASSLTLGIYLIEPLVTHFFYMPFFDLIHWHPVISTPFSFVWCLMCMGIGGGVTWLLRKLPGMKKFI